MLFKSKIWNIEYKTDKSKVFILMGLSLAHLLLLPITKILGRVVLNFNYFR